MKKIGYMGDIGSNSKIAAEFFKTIHNIDAELIPCIDAKNTVLALNNNLIDYGIFAYENLITGKVKETQEIIENINFNLVDNFYINIHHCIFKKYNSKKLNYIMSSLQVLDETKKTRKKLFPNLIELVCADQSKAAKELSLNLFSDDVAVICNEEYGLSLGLERIYQNLEDNKENQTTFHVYSK